MTTLTNSFHGTKTTVRENIAGENQFDQFGNLSIFAMEERKRPRQPRRQHEKMLDGGTWNRRRILGCLFFGRREIDERRL